MIREKTIFCCVSGDLKIRRKMIARLAVDMKLAVIPSDAMKLIQGDVFSIDLMNDYLILCDTVDLNENTWILKTLFRRAVMGAPVVIGVKKVTKQMEYMCSIHYPEDLERHI